MCLTIPDNITRPFIAKRDIKVYKILTINILNEWHSPFMLKEYIPWETYTSDLEIVRTGRVEDGLHSIVSLKEAIELANDMRPYRYGEFIIIVEAIIPKGSRYYKGTFDKHYSSIASDALYITNKILWKDGTVTSVGFGNTVETYILRLLKKFIK